MKKTFLFVLTVLVVITSTLLLASCGDDDQVSPQSVDSSTPGLVYASYPNEGYAALIDFGMHTTDTEIVIASVYDGLPVTSIEKDACDDCEIVTVMIPASVTNIGEGAFSSCKELTSVIFAGGSQLTNIGASAFIGCENLSSIEIPDNVTSIAEYAFSGCSGLKSITLPDGITSISKGTFSSCGITSVEIPASVASIGDFAFDDCVSLKSVNFAKGSQLVTIGNQSFYKCAGLKSITIPKNVAAIGRWAFSGCHMLENIAVESGNTAYHSSGNCLIATASKTLRLTCKNSVIPTDDSVTRIAEDAFDTGGNLVSLTIPENITSIADDAFGPCFKLVQITNLSTIDLKQHRLSLKSNPGQEIRTAVHIPFSNKLHTDAEGYVSYQVDDTVYFLDYIGDSVALDLSNKGFDAIYKRALYERHDIKSIAISASVTSIGNHAFWNCTGLTSIEIPASVTSIGEWAFGTCDNLKNAVFAVKDGWWREFGGESTGISATDLANPITAAKYLTDIYSGRYNGEWKRG